MNSSWTTRVYTYIFSWTRDESKISKVSGKFSPSNNSWRDCVYLSSPRNNRKFSFILQGRWGSLRVAWKEGKEFAQVSKTVPFAIRACEMQALLSNSAAVEFIIDLSARRVAIFSGSSDSLGERERELLFLSFWGCRNDLFRSIKSSCFPPRIFFSRFSFGLIKRWQCFEILELCSIFFLFFFSSFN